MKDPDHRLRNWRLWSGKKSYLGQPGPMVMLLKEYMQLIAYLHPSLLDEW